MVPLGTLLTKVRERLDEFNVSESAWTSTQLRRWIMEGANDIARVTECLQDRQTIAVVANVQEYSASANAIRIHRVEYTDTSTARITPLEIVDIASGDALWYSDRLTARSNRPQYVSFWGFPPDLKLILYPTPNIAGFLYVFYYRFPQQLAVDGSQDSANVEIPTGWDDLVCEYAVSLALQRDGNPAWQERRGIYESRLDDMVSRTRKWHDQPSMVMRDVSPLSAWWQWEDYY